MSKNAPITEEDRWFRGEAKQIVFDIVDAAELPIDVSAFTLEWVLEADGDSVDVLVKEAPDITIGNGAGTNDRVTVQVAAADTISLAATLYRHALRRVDAGQEQVLAEGAALLQAAPARDVGA